MERNLTITIEDALDGQTIKQVLKQQLMVSSRLLSRLKTRDNAILLNNEPAFVNKTLKIGDILIIRLEEQSDESFGIVPKAGDFSIIYEDDDVLLINKSPNLSVHPSMGNYYDTLANYVAYYFLNKGQSLKFRAVNRLDKNTSGLMIIAKNQFAHGVMSKDIKEGRLKREYMAIVNGVIEKDEGIIEAPIARAQSSAIERMVRDDGKYARTDFYVEKRLENATLVRIVTQTGRTHQIRVHFKHIGHPLLSDFLYGKEQNEFINRHALHSYKIVFFQPVNKQKMEFKIELPNDMIDALNILENSYG